MIPPWDMSCNLSKPFFRGWLLTSPPPPFLRSRLPNPLRCLLCPYLLRCRLTGLDPWLPLDTQLVPGYVRAVDLNDTAYLAEYGTALTRGSVRWDAARWAFRTTSSFNPAQAPHCELRVLGVRSGRCCLWMGG